jgi:hypothetical protein
MPSTDSNLSAVVGRAASDADFRALLLTDPESALAGYKLSEAETAALGSLTPESFNGLASELDARVSFSVIWGSNPIKGGDGPEDKGAPPTDPAPDGFAWGS